MNSSEELLKTLVNLLISYQDDIRTAPDQVSAIARTAPDQVSAIARTAPDQVSAIARTAPDQVSPYQDDQQPTNNLFDGRKESFETFEIEMKTMLEKTCAYKRSCLANDLEALYDHSHAKIFKRLYNQLGVSIVNKNWMDSDEEVDHLIDRYLKFKGSDQPLKSQLSSALYSDYNGIILQPDSAWSTFIAEWDTYLETKRPIKQQASVAKRLAYSFNTMKDGLLARVENEYDLTIVDIGYFYKDSSTFFATAVMKDPISIQTLVCSIVDDSIDEIQPVNFREMIKDLGDLSHVQYLMSKAPPQTSGTGIHGDHQGRQPVTSVSPRPAGSMQDADSPQTQTGTSPETLFVAVLKDCDLDRNLYLKWLDVQIRMKVPDALTIARNVAKIMQMLQTKDMTILPIKPTLFELMDNNEVRLIDMTRGLFKLSSKHKNQKMMAREMIKPSDDMYLFEFNQIDYFIRRANGKNDERSKKRVIKLNDVFYSFGVFMLWLFAKGEGQKKIESFLDHLNPIITLPSFIGLTICKIIEDLLSPNSQTLVISFTNIISLIDAEIAIAHGKRDELAYARALNSHYRRR